MMIFERFFVIFFGGIYLLFTFAASKRNLLSPKAMTKEERHEMIMEALIKHGSVQVSDLVSMLDVSAVTVRKDLTDLEKSDKLYRSHGKAVLVNPYINNRSVNEKERLSTDEKHAIGREAARLITRDDSIAIASGTTVHALARNIQPIHKLTVVSASLAVSNILSQHENIDIIQLGGMLRHSSLSVVGEYAADILSQCSFSKLYLGVDGIDFEFGITTTDMREATLNQKMIAAAQKTIVLADSSKFGRRGFAKIADIDVVDIIITDAGISPKVVNRIEDLGIELIVAQCLQANRGPGHRAHYRKIILQGGYSCYSDYRDRCS